jgi:methylmalonyl-CoA carboxyltransferase large subunit
MSETDTTVADLLALLAQLAARVQTLEEQAARRHPEAGEDVMLAIAAACAAYLGKRATVKQVHLRRGATWVAQGRTAVQQSHADLQGPPGDRHARPIQQVRRGMT